MLDGNSESEEYYNNLYQKMSDTLILGKKSTTTEKCDKNYLIL